MKNLPRIHFWWDRIDDQALVINACRAFAEPSNGVFMLVARPGYFSLRERDEMQAVAGNAPEGSRAPPIGILRTGVAEPSDGSGGMGRNANRHANVKKSKINS